MLEEELDSDVVRRVFPQRAYVSVPINEEIPMTEVMSVVDACETAVASDVQMMETGERHAPVPCEELEREMNVESPDAAPTRTIS